MNVFLLDYDHNERARAHCDVHVNKMTLEAVQMINTALFENGLDHLTFYSPTHAGHPWTDWTGKNLSNFKWMVNHAIALGHEFNTRNGKEHASLRKLLDSNIIRATLPSVELNEEIIGSRRFPSEDLRTKFPVCTGEYRTPADQDPVEAYRDYYADVKQPKDWFSYGAVEPPEWLHDRI